MFSVMMASIEDEAIEAIFKIQAARPERFQGVFSSVPQELVHPEVAKFEPPQEEQVVMGEAPFGGANVASIPPKFEQKPFQASQEKIGRNDPCPCGSGKKYKKCCGK
ncbi:MAG: SEC-C domain-containing protein [Candidatus Omnitrophica bacterium]|nr:SEC-C domain-containing protein [Candidatus Omnitrophota bacterium]MBU1869511.1 SEC-C domain-containing protein [Candidatus Omnitrophota bacterium]